MPLRRILHVIPSVGALRGGPSTMVRSLARDLSREGFETHVATTDDNGPVRLDVPRGVPVVQEGVTYWYFPRQTRFYTFSWPLGRWLARHVSDFDVIHIHALFSYAALPAAFWATRRGVPYVVRPLGTLNAWGMTHRRPWLKGLSFRLVERRVIDHAALMHYTSEQERREAEQLPGVHAPAVVIPNALPPVGPPQAPGAFRAKHSAIAGRRIVLFLSRFDEKKGIDLLLQAFAGARARMPNTCLVLAGGGTPGIVDRIDANIRRLDLGADVVRPGFLEHEEKGAAFADADVFVLPSHSENFGIAVAEAMAAGLPVIVSDQVGIHEEIVEAGAGLAVPCDAGRIAEALRQVMSDPDARAMGQRGRALAESRYSQTAVTRQVIAAYRSVVH